MTLVVAATSPESIWMLVDRRLSYSGRPPKDDAQKLMTLETTDGIAVLGYAGLGATGLGTEPAHWMSAVLRGRKNLTLEQSLGILSDAMKRQLPKHMVHMPVSGGPAHSTIIPAFLGNEVRLYSIDMVFSPDRTQYKFRYTRHVTSLTTPRTPRLGIGGSGAFYLIQNKKWKRSLLRVLRAADRRQVTPNVVADHLAALNYEVHQHLSDKSVGPRCIVAWRHSKGSSFNGGGAHCYYTGTTRDANLPAVPTIGNGTDVSALADVLMPHFTKTLGPFFEARQQPGELDISALNQDLAQLPNKPDDNLR